MQTILRILIISVLLSASALIYALWYIMKYKLETVKRWAMVRFGLFTEKEVLNFINQNCPNQNKMALENQLFTYKLKRNVRK